ncbi:MAG: phytanoyl-CoA dioxygenase family protein [Parvibaculum sp.]|uniref:phytanoyl-CoA dioxygenase family protein n=1 Tax=Parvibaculum sp. TaxID=2024848 RepID=UPI0025E8873C|nr:phytanoyl-CoA dioxygenase family protein [Parvibaculum sp.]MCE9651116.1 phytanoyl-CoA dioxygenase family protein [Parvibaculum sp.]
MAEEMLESLGAQRHARNAGFEWRAHRGPFRLLSEAEARQYDEQGFVVLKNVIPRQVIETLIAEIDPIEAHVEEFVRSQANGELSIAKAGAISFTTHIVRKSQILRDFCKSKIFRDLCHDTLGPDVRLYWDQAVYKKPDAARVFPWHQDNGYAYVEPQQYLTCWVPLVDATLENGCPWIVPGLHREGTFAHKARPWGLQCFDIEASDVPKGAIAAPASVGDIVVFSSLTPHSTGPNLTQSVRKAYIVQFAPDGAQIIEADGKRVPATDEARQFLIMKHGEPA